MVELLPAATILDVEPDRWVQVAEDLYIGATADRVFIHWEPIEPLTTVTFGPRTWAAILKVIESERAR